MEEARQYPAVSSRGRKYWQDAEERWPELQQLLSCYLHQDWPDEFESPSAAVDAAVAETPIDQRKQACRQWMNWNGTAGCRNDVKRAMDEGLGVNVYFETDKEARAFMDQVYDKLIVSVRKEIGRDWKP